MEVSKNANSLRTLSIFGAGVPKSANSLRLSAIFMTAAQKAWDVPQVSGIYRAEPETVNPWACQKMQVPSAIPQFSRPECPESANSVTLSAIFVTAVHKARDVPQVSGIQRAEPETVDLFHHGRVKKRNYPEQSPNFRDRSAQKEQTV